MALVKKYIAAVLLQLSMACAPHTNGGAAQDVERKANDSHVRATDAWASATEAQLLRRARQVADFTITRALCVSLHCQLTVLDSLQEKGISSQLGDWLKETWTYHWKVEDITRTDTQHQVVTIRLYRHPADRGTPDDPGFSSLSGGSVNPCARGADCNHPNWNEPYICDHNETGCPAIVLDGKRLCFEDLRLACDCAKLRKIKLDCNEDGYPY